MFKQVENYPHDKRTIPMINLKNGQIAEVINVKVKGRIVKRFDVNYETYFLILNEPRITGQHFNYYDGSTNKQVRILEPNESITIMFYNEE